jgi:hypothetical protein
MPDEFYRQEVILKLQPNKNSTLAPKILPERLHNQGTSVDLRTIQRDLKNPRQRFFHVRSKKVGSSNHWRADSPLHQPSINPCKTRSKRAKESSRFDSAMARILLSFQRIAGSSSI